MTVSRDTACRTFSETLCNMLQHTATPYIPTTDIVTRHSVPGFFRICYAWPAVTEDDPTIAMRELKSRLLKHFEASIN